MILMISISAHKRSYFRLAYRYGTQLIKIWKKHCELLSMKRFLYPPSFVELSRQTPWQLGMLKDRQKQIFFKKSQICWNLNISEGLNGNQNAIFGIFGNMKKKKKFK